MYLDLQHLMPFRFPIQLIPNIDLGNLLEGQVHLVQCEQGKVFNVVPRLVIIRLLANKFSC